MFENDVKMYGTQTVAKNFTYHIRFENDVKMYGTQTKKKGGMVNERLRMM